VALPFGARQFILAFDASSVSGGVARGQTFQGITRVPLSAGALSVSAQVPNLAASDEVLEAVRSVTASLKNPPRARVLLPSGVARLVLLQGPEKGVDPQSLARFRLARSLPYPEEEAVVDAVQLPGGRLVGVAIRRTIVENYEGLLARAGVAHQRIDLTPMAALLGLERRSPKTGGCSLVLGDAALVYCLRGREGIVALRSRVRDRGDHEARFIGADLERTARVLGKDLAIRMIRVVGPGATEVVAGLMRLGLPAELGWSLTGVPVPEEPSEIPWLGAAVA